MPNDDDDDAENGEDEEENRTVQGAEDWCDAYLTIIIVPYILAILHALYLDPLCVRLITYL